MCRRDTVERIIVANVSQGKPYRRLNGLLLHQQIGEPFAFLVSNRSYSRLVEIVNRSRADANTSAVPRGFQELSPLRRRDGLSLLPAHTGETEAPMGYQEGRESEVCPQSFTKGGKDGQAYWIP